MSFWVHRGSLGWDNGVSLANSTQLLDLYIFSSGPSLANVDLKMFDQKPVYKFGINTTYPKVKPDIWLGLDRPTCFNKNLWSESFIKILNGRFSEEKIDLVNLKSFPNTYFADFTDMPETDKESIRLIFKNTEKDSKLLWQKNTLISSLHLAIMMGFKRIHMLGSDFGGRGDYFDDSKDARPNNYFFEDDKIDRDSPSGKISKKQREVNKRLYSEQLSFIKKLIPPCEARGIKIISCSKNSPLNEITKFIEPDEALSQSIERLKQKVKVNF
tara:strand:+ start:3084 stop:3896 length:813 start_codon:yes stop_codon:yes gene_type:complete